MSGVCFCLVHVLKVCGDYDYEMKEDGMLDVALTSLSLTCIYCWRRSRRRKRGEKQLSLELQRDIIAFYKPDRRGKSCLSWGIVLAKEQEYQLQEIII